MSLSTMKGEDGERDRKRKKASTGQLMSEGTGDRDF